MTESELIKRITDMRDENRRYKKEISILENEKRQLENEIRHLSERVKMLEYEKNKLLDDLKRVGGDKERDFRAGKITAYSEAIRVVLDLIKE